jgi:hypothetical protein
MHTFAPESEWIDPKDYPFFLLDKIKVLDSFLGGLGAYDKI